MNAEVELLAAVYENEARTIYYPSGAENTQKIQLKCGRENTAESKEESLVTKLYLEHPMKCVIPAPDFSRKLTENGE